jgi:integrase
MISAEELERACDVRNVRGTRLPAGRALERQEIADLLAVCRADPRPAGRRDEAIVATLWTTGLRRAELVGLDLDNLSADHATLTIIGKGDKEREVYLNEDAIAILERWLDLRGPKPGAVFNAINKAGVIRISGHLSPSTVRDILLRRADQAGVSPFAPHSVRRTHASEMLDRTDVLTVQKLGGWSPASTSVLARYDRRSAATARAAIDGLKLPA